MLKGIVEPELQIRRIEGLRQLVHQNIRQNGRFKHTQKIYFLHLSIYLGCLTNNTYILCFNFN
jgi:hypothetical protein